MELSNTEWLVMQEVWRLHEAGLAVTVPAVHEALQTETAWAYSTAKTILTRLAEKGALEMRRNGKQSIFRPLISQQVAQRTATENLLSRAFQGAVGGLMQHLLGGRKISKQDRDYLRQLLEEEEGRTTQPASPGKRKGS